MRAVGDDARDERRRLVEHVFAVVQHQQCPRAAQCADEQGGRVADRPVRRQLHQAERVDGGTGHTLRRGVRSDGSQLHQRHPPGEGGPGAPGRLDGEPRLAGAAGAHHGDEPTVGDEPSQLAKLAFPADEARHRLRQRRPRRPRRLRRVCGLHVGHREPLAEQDRQVPRDKPGQLPRRGEVLVRRAVVVLDASQQRPEARLPAGRRVLHVHQPRQVPAQPVLVLQAGHVLARSDPAVPAPGRSPGTRGSAPDRPGRAHGADAGELRARTSPAATAAAQPPRRTADRSAASSPSVELTNTRTRWSGVRIGTSTLCLPAKGAGPLPWLEPTLVSCERSLVPVVAIQASVRQGRGVADTSVVSAARNHAHARLRRGTPVGVWASQAVQGLRSQDTSVAGTVSGSGNRPRI